jgi:hypothetical protein
VRPVAGLDLSRTIYLYTRRSGRARPALEALAGALREGAAEHLAPPTRSGRRPPRAGAGTSG